ncbi:holothin acyltransferase-like [Oculina patagonica]
MALLVASRVLSARLSSRFFALAYTCRTLAKEAECLQFSKTYTCLSAKEIFKIRPIETVEEFESVIINAMAKEGWRPGLKDAECFLTCDPSGAFVGELNGKPVCTINLTRYDDSFIFSGCYMVNKEYRGKGYGIKMKNVAFAYAKQSRSIGIVSAALGSEQVYKRWGFCSHFYGATFVFHLPTAMTHFPETSERSVKVKSIEEVNLEALFMYDTAVFGFERHAFLSKWLRVAGSHARVAVNNEGSIVGYTVARPLFVKEEGYKIGPLFADSEAVAEKLLRGVFEELFRQGDSRALVVSIDAPTKKATELCERLQGKRAFELVYMVTNGLPDARFDKWFGYTSTQLS